MLELASASCGLDQTITNAPPGAIAMAEVIWLFVVVVLTRNSEPCGTAAALKRWAKMPLATSWQASKVWRRKLPTSEARCRSCGNSLPMAAAQARSLGLRTIVKGCLVDDPRVLVAGGSVLKRPRAVQVTVEDRLGVCRRFGDDPQLRLWSSAGVSGLVGLLYLILIVVFWSRHKRTRARKPSAQGQ